MRNLILVMIFFGLIQLVNSDIKTSTSNQGCGSVICD